MRSRALAALGFVVLLAACASPAANDATPPASIDATPSLAPDPTPEPTPTPDPTPPPTPTPEPTPDLAAFARMYVDLVAPYNQVVCDFQVVLENLNASRADLEPLAQRMADASRAWVDGARAIDWPEETQEAIDELVRSTAGQEAALRAAIGSSNDAAFFENLNRSFEESAAGAGAAQLIRITLDLEGIPANACDS